MKIDHIGYAVKNIDKAKKQMEMLGFSFEETVTDADRNISILLLARCAVTGWN